ncbi:cyclic peptide export ABC transporter [Alteromonas sp. 5E99-2]|uniref:cyclic peptide export ABC transporter n=1 Tax=Alteromonas sp. 5E99-2 TaxID=2817683 RepID=UPI001A98A391|nr:cyclic peptide export ABC transporter [Alteromonas sp. 5E99-2]
MLSYLIKQSQWLFITATIAGVISGACGVLLLTVINSTISSPTMDDAMNMLWPFIFYVTIGMLTRMLSLVLFHRLKEHVHANIRQFITSQVIAADYSKIERLGGAKVQSALTDHSQNVSDFFISLPRLIMNGAIVAGCLLYLAILSIEVLLVAVVVIGLGAFCYHFVHLQAIKHLKVASVEQDNLFNCFDSLIYGAKELRLHKEKRHWFKEEVLGRSINTVRKARTKGMSMFVISVSWSNFLVYGFIGVVLFALVGDVDNRVELMTGFTLLFVYMITPLESLLLNLPKANLAKISAGHIDEVTNKLEEHEEIASLPIPLSFNELTFSNVSHSYYHEQSDEIFSLPAINVTFKKAELIYLVGGNGSGKTTFAKLVSGLYNPEQGEVRLDGKVVTSADRDNYRQLFTSIFSDFHLFDTLLGNSTPEFEKKGNALIRKLNLHHKVKIENGAFTTKTLSQGQRKRLALVVSYLEDRPFYLFDEWAADQDPTFKDVFYKELLPELTSRGKTVFVISHDDKYFHLADRLLKMDNGYLSEIPVPAFMS